MGASDPLLELYIAQSSVRRRFNGKWLAFFLSKAQWERGRETCTHKHTNQQESERGKAGKQGRCAERTVDKGSQRHTLELYSLQPAWWSEALLLWDFICSCFSALPCLSPPSSTASFPFQQVNDNFALQWLTRCFWFLICLAPILTPWNRKGIVIARDMWLQNDRNPKLIIFLFWSVSSLYLSFIIPDLRQNSSIQEYGLFYYRALLLDFSSQRSPEGLHVNTLHRLKWSRWEERQMNHTMYIRFY